MSGDNISGIPKVSIFGIFAILLVSCFPLPIAPASETKYSHLIAVNIVEGERIEIFSSVKETRKGEAPEFVYVYSFRNAGKKLIEFNFGPPLNFYVRVEPGQIRHATFKSKVKPEKTLIGLLAIVIHGSKIWTLQDFGVSMIYAPLPEKEKPIPPRLRSGFCFFAA